MDPAVDSMTPDDVRKRAALMAQQQGAARRGYVPMTLDSMAPSPGAPAALPQPNFGAMTAADAWQKPVAPAPVVAPPVVTPPVTGAAAGTAAGGVVTTPAYQAPPDLPAGVRNTNQGGIYEGKSVDGSRNFGDNPYSTNLTGGISMTRRSPGDRAAMMRLFNNTPGFTDASGRAPVQMMDPNSRDIQYKHNIAPEASLAQGYDAGSRTGAMPYTRQWEIENQKLPTAADVDPEGKMNPEQLRSALSAQINTNKQALAMSRVQRGQATGAGLGTTPGSASATPGAGFAGSSAYAGMPPGVNPLDFLKIGTQADVREREAAVSERGQQIGLQKTNEDRGNSIHASRLDEFTKANPKANPSDLADAAAIAAARDMDAAGIDPATTTKGRQGMKLLAEHLAKYTAPNVGTATEVPPEQADLSKFSIENAGGIGRALGHPATARGPHFAPDPNNPGKMTEVPEGTPGSTQESTTGYARSMSPALQMASGGNLNVFRGIIERRRNRVMQDAADETKQGASRRFKY